ncbi:Protocadherin Fat 1, partial [Araneus ventricosus]
MRLFYSIWNNNRFVFHPFNPIHIDPCSSNPCKNNAKCKINGSNYTCVCDEHFAGDMCQEGNLPKSCDSEPCLNGGACQKVDEGFHCSCTFNYFGERCENEYCFGYACENGGICSVQNGTNICSCVEPYKGQQCEESPCDSNPCKNDGQCEIKDHEVKCNCIEPYIGEYCEEAEETTSILNVTDSPITSTDLDTHETDRIFIEIQTRDEETTSESTSRD